MNVKARGCRSLITTLGLRRLLRLQTLPASPWTSLGASFHRNFHVQQRDSGRESERFLRYTCRQYVQCLQSILKAIVNYSWELQYVVSDKRIDKFSEAWTVLNETTKTMQLSISSK